MKRHLSRQDLRAPIAGRQRPCPEGIDLAPAGALVEVEGNVVPLRTRREWELWHRGVEGLLRTAVD